MLERKGEGKSACLIVTMMIGVQLIDGSSPCLQQCSELKVRVNAIQSGLTA